MPILGKTGLSISRLGLGTVEIGLPYGINVTALPSNKEAETILKTAIDLGITYIDTARGYGVAEERIGNSGIKNIKDVVIGTKCAQFLEQGEDPRDKELEHRIRDDIEASLRNLRVDSLQLVQLHGGSAEQIKRGELIAIMQKLLDEGKVQHIGITTRGKEAALAAIKSDFFETIQTAYSILDQRMAEHVLPQAQTSNVGVICRSVLLKGALTPAVAKLPPELAPLKKSAKKAKQIAAEIGCDLPALAIRFAASNSAISTVLLGTTKPKHLQTAQQAIEEGSPPNSILQKLAKCAINEPSQVDPAQWPK